MSTQAQIDAARQNGAKSHGPTSQEGRQKSSRNAVQHGLFAQTLVLPHEDREQFDQLHLSYFAKFQPVDDVEAGLVQEMVAAKWRQKRAWALETNTLELELIRKEAEINQQFTHIENDMRLAVAHESLCNQSKTLAQIARAEAAYSRQFDRALRNLLKLRQSGLISASMEELQNEPESAPLATAVPVQNEPKPDKPCPSADHGRSGDHISLSSDAYLADCTRSS